jgi:hypothetical protein
MQVKEGETGIDQIIMIQFIEIPMFRVLFYTKKLRLWMMTKDQQ